MSNSNRLPDPLPTAAPSTDATESFGEALSQFDRSHAGSAGDSSKQLEGTVVAVTADTVIVDIGFKSEGILPLAPFQAAGEEVKPGDRLPVSVKGRGADGYYELSRLRVAVPTDWSSLQKAFDEQLAIVGTVTGVVKGGLSVDVGVRAFMPASRSGARDAAQMEKMIGEQITCRILKLDVADEDVVVDRRAVAEEEVRLSKEQRYAQLSEGDTVQGEVRSLTDYGAFVDLGGVDGLLHVSDIAWTRISSPADVLSVGQQVEARVLKIDQEKRRISLGMKQLQPHPWDAVPEKYKAGERVRGVVSRVTDFGAFVELEPGVEGLIHLSEMSWAKKVRRPADLLKPGDSVEAVILGVNNEERRISLGLKQTLGDPWAEAARRFPVGSQIEGPVTSIMKFGAFVELAEGVEGMVHVSEIVADKHIHHPQDVLRLGQTVKAQVLAVDTEKRQLRLSMKQLIPTSLDEYMAEHKVGDVVSGRVVDDSSEAPRVELGEGIRAAYSINATGSATETAEASGKPDLSALSSMLKARWKGGPTAGSSKPEALRAGQVRSFRITNLDTETKTIRVEAL